MAEVNSGRQIHAFVAVAVAVADDPRIGPHSFAHGPLPAAARPSHAAAGAPQSCTSPPSADSSVPVMKLAWAEARNSTTFAISSGCARRPSGTLPASMASSPSAWFGSGARPASPPRCHHRPALSLDVGEASADPLAPVRSASLRSRRATICATSSERAMA